MRRLIGLCVSVAALSLVLPSAALAQAVITGSVKDTSGAVLPGVSVEAASPVLIEKVRSSITDAAGQYRIEDLRPGTYTITFTLPGFTTFRREDVELTGSFIATINADLKVGTLEETVVVTGASPIVDVQSARRQTTLSTDVIRSIPTVRNYNSMVVLVPGVITNANDVATGPLINQFPIHGGRANESRLTVDGLNVGNPPGGNQPPTYVADVGNSQEVTFTTSGGLGESETAGLVMNIVPKTGGNRYEGAFYFSGTGEHFQSSNYTEELRAAGMSRQKAGYIRSLAELVLSGELDLADLPADDEEAIAHLVKIKGIGRWSAEIYLLFAEGRADVFPAGDLAVLIELGKLMGLDGKPSEKQLREMAERWRPHRGAAAVLAWHSYNSDVL